MTDAAHSPSTRPATGAARYLATARLRLWSGLVIVFYCLIHFINHAAGVFLVDAMDEARIWLMFIWRGVVGQTVLYGALFLHAGLSLQALYRRRNLRMPPAEAAQLAFGVLVPVLIMEHVVSTRIAEDFLGIDSTYERLVIRYWVEEPWHGAQVALLLIIVWVHACVGLHFWLRRHRWYARTSRMALLAAVLIPVLALAGFVSSGVALATKIASNPIYAQSTADIGGTAGQRAILDATESWMLLGYVAVVVGVLGARGLREWRERRFNPMRIRYLSGRDVVVPRGFSILEASRFAGVPHSSVCGGRGRCSTCRVRVLAASGSLPEPEAGERVTLDRIRAPADIRLACQLRPDGDVTVHPLVPARVDRRREPELDSLETGREIDIAALFIDMRRSTELTVNKLPYDAFFIVDRYLDTVLRAIRDHGGQVTSIAGDGVMAIFGLVGDIRVACQDAVDTSRAVWRGIDRLNRELADDLPWPLRFGIGIHAGISVVGVSRASGWASVQFLGDTGNVANRLERLSKELGQPVIVSRRVADLASVPVEAADIRRVELNGRRGEIDVVPIARLDDLGPGRVGRAA